MRSKKVKPAFIGHGWSHYLYWEQHNKRIFKRVNKLIKSIYRDGAFKGIGKPELLRYQYRLPTCSRRIDSKNRFTIKFRILSVVEATTNRITKDKSRLF